MGHKNYSKFSKHFKKQENHNEVMEGQITIEDIINEEVTEISNEELQNLNDVIKGVVTGCKKLNVRKTPLA